MPQNATKKHGGNKKSFTSQIGHDDHPPACRMEGTVTPTG
jgi:hypothetical protein